MSNIIEVSGEGNPVLPIEVVVDVKYTFDRFVAELKAQANNNELKCRANAVLAAVEEMHRTVHRLPAQGRTVTMEGKGLAEFSGIIGEVTKYAKKKGLIPE